MKSAFEQVARIRTNRILAYENRLLKRFGELESYKRKELIEDLERKYLALRRFVPMLGPGDLEACLKLPEVRAAVDPGWKPFMPDTNDPVWKAIAVDAMSQPVGLFKNMPPPTVRTLLGELVAYLGQMRDGDPLLGYASDPAQGSNEQRQHRLVRAVLIAVSQAWRSAQVKSS